MGTVPIESGHCDFQNWPLRLETKPNIPCSPVAALNKPHTHHGFFAPHHTARFARLVTIEDKVEGRGDWAVNLYLDPGFRKIANDALNGTASGPKNLGAF